MGEAGFGTRRKLSGAIVLAFGLGLCGASGAGAQELKHEFINPSFGGNPFNSSHLIGIATAQRPEREVDPREELTPAQQFARSIQTRLLSALSLGVVEAITGADPGSSGEFVIGDQRITFERTLSEIRLRIVDENTGEVTEIVVPVFEFADQVAAAQASASAESSLLGVNSTTSVGGSSLEGGSLEAPLGSGL